MSGARDSGYYSSSALVQQGITKVAQEMHDFIVEEGQDNVNTRCYNSSTPLARSVPIITPKLVDFIVLDQTTRFAHLP